MCMQIIYIDVFMQFCSTRIYMTEVIICIYTYKLYRCMHCIHIQTACCCLIIQSCQTLYNPMDCSLPGSSVHGILQARILEWVAISSSRGSSQPRDRTRVSHTTGIFFTTEPPGKSKSV